MLFHGGADVISVYKVWNERTTRAYELTMENFLFVTTMIHREEENVTKHNYESKPQADILERLGLGTPRKGEVN